MSDGEMVTFANARLDEDEAWFTDGAALADDPVAEDLCQRLLREVAFKRAILALHMPQPFWGNNPPPVRDQTPENVVSWYCECQWPDGVIEGMYPCGEARLLVSVYSGHPDYRAGWKP